VKSVNEIKMKPQESAGDI